MDTSEPRTTTPQDLNAAEPEIIGRVFHVECRVDIRRWDRVTLSDRQASQEEVDQIDSPENAHTRLLVKMPGLALLLRCCGHMTIGGPVGSIHGATVTGEIRPSQVPPFRWMLVNVSKIAACPAPPISFLPPVVELDLSDVGVYTQEEIDDLDRGVSKHVSEARIRELERRREW